MINYLVYIVIYDSDPDESLENCQSEKFTSHEVLATNSKKENTYFKITIEIFHPLFTKIMSQTALCHQKHYSKFDRLGREETEDS